MALHHTKTQGQNTAKEYTQKWSQFQRQCLFDIISTT